MSYPEIPDLPPAPLRRQPEEDYAATASAFVGAMNPWGRAVNAAGAWMRAALESAQTLFNQTTQAAGTATGAAGTAVDSASAAQGYAQQANAFAQVAATNASFRGEWSTLSGPLSVPAAVYHEGAYWQLLRDIPNVAVSEPGVSADWSTAQTEITAWTPISGNVTLSPNVPYAVTFASGQQLTLPAAPAANDVIRLYKRAGSAAGAIVRRNGKTIMGLAQDMTIDGDVTGLEMIYTGTDWRIIG